TSSVRSPPFKAPAAVLPPLPPVRDVRLVADGDRREDDADEECAGGDGGDHVDNDRAHGSASRSPSIPTPIAIARRCPAAAPSTPACMSRSARFAACIASRRATVRLTSRHQSTSSTSTPPRDVSWTAVKESTSLARDPGDCSSRGVVPFTAEDLAGDLVA